MDEILITTDLVVGSEPELTDQELCERVLAMFACHDPDEATPEADAVLQFVKEVRQLHFFG
jgi:hypothetical protein